MSFFSLSLFFLRLWVLSLTSEKEYLSTVINFSAHCSTTCHNYTHSLTHRPFPFSPNSSLDNLPTGVPVPPAFYLIN